MYSLMRGFGAFPLLMTVASAVTAGTIAISLLIGSDRLYASRQQEAAMLSTEQAIQGFVLANSRLPCPDTSSVPDGVEDCGLTQTMGAVPYRTLGLSGKSVMGLAYVPYMDNVAATSLTDAGSNSDVVQVVLPEELPALNLRVVTPPDDTINDSYTAQDPAVVTATVRFDLFFTSLLTDSAVDADYIAVGNSYGGSYISGLTSLLLMEIEINDPGDPSDDGDDGYEFYEADSGVRSASSRYTELAQFVGSLWRYKTIVDSRYATLGDSEGMWVVGSDFNTISTDTSMTDSAKLSSLQAVKTDLLNLVSSHNIDVASFNGRSSGTTVIDGYFVIASDDLSAIDLTDYTAGMSSSDYSVFKTALSDAIAISRSVFISNGQTLADKQVQSSDAVQLKVNSLKSSYPSRYAALTPGAEDAPLTGNELLLWQRYGTLISVVNYLFEDLYCRATDLDDLDGDGNTAECIADTAQQGYVDLINSLSPTFDPDTQSVPADTGIDPDAVDTSGVADSSFSGPFYTSGTQAVTYPEYVNMADFCQKLVDIAALTPAYRSISYARTESSSSGLPAFLLIEKGNNLKIDDPNLLSSNSSVFAEPDRDRSLSYDDRVRPMPVSKLNISLGCTPLLQSFESYANVVAEAELLHQEASGALKDAEVEVVTGSIGVSLATMRLAVDIAGVIKDSIGGSAAVSVCAATLGIAANFCASAGLQFAAAASRGAAIAGDAIALGQSIAALALAVDGRDSAQASLDSIEFHLGVAVSDSINGDSRGGVSEAP